MSTNRLQTLAQQNLGLSRKEVRLAPHNPRWKRAFSDEAYFIFDQLRNESLKLYHCGSTSVPELESKPVIDILGSVKSLKHFDQHKEALENIGYEYKGEYGIEGRRYCVLYNPEKTEAYVHLHVFEDGHQEINKHLNFRDHLRANADDRTLYQTHKRKLIEDKTPRASYSEAKHEVITEIQKRANSKGPHKKVLAIHGAAEGNKNTVTFLREQYSGKDLEIVDLNGANIGKFSYTNRQAENFVKIIKQALEADLIVLATPVYWYAMSGAMKDFMDRFSNLMSGEHKHLGEALYGKKLELVSTGYDFKLPMGFEVPFAGTAIYFGMDYLGARYKSVR